MKAFTLMIYWEEGSAQKKKKGKKNIINKSYIWKVWFGGIDTTLLNATTPSQSGPGIDGNEEVLCILQSFSISGASPSDCLVSYTGHSFEEVLPLYRDAVSVFYSCSLLMNLILTECSIL